MSIAKFLFACYVAGFWAQMLIYLNKDNNDN